MREKIVSVEPSLTSAPPLEIHDLTVAYHKKPVLWGIDLAVPTGKLVGIVGSAVAHERLPNGPRHGFLSAEIG